MSDRDAPDVAAPPPVTAMTLVALDLPHPSPSPATIGDDLEARIADARQRATAARDRADARRQEIDVAVRAETAAADATLAELARRHDATLEQIRNAAQAEVQRIEADGSRATDGIDETGAEDAR